MFKIAFHGGLTNVWGGVMKIPEARQVKLCMTEHTECMSYEVLIIIVITIISMSLSLHMESYKVLISVHHCVSFMMSVTSIVIVMTITTIMIIIAN